MKHARIIIAAVLFILLYRPVFGPLVREWTAVQDYSHGFLIPFISAYFLWNKRSELKGMAASPSAAGIIVIFAGAALYLLAIIGYQFFLQCLSMLVVLFGIVYAYAGPAIARQAAFPIGYLIFMIPLPQLVYTTITFHLRLFSTKLAFFVISMLGIDATREGNIVHLSTCSLVVANPCSGLRGLTVFMAASLAIGYIFQKSVKNRVILLLSGVALAVAMNTARLVVTGVLADLMKLSQVPASLHDATGIVAIVAGLGILFMINDFLKKAR